MYNWTALVTFTNLRQGTVEYHRVVIILLLLGIGHLGSTVIMRDTWWV